jgi:hypothetical protein
MGAQQSSGGQAVAAVSKLQHSAIKCSADWIKRFVDLIKTVATSQVSKQV